MGLSGKDILGMSELDAHEIAQILESAKSMKEVVRSGVKRTGHLLGKTVVTLFYESSTRTRLSFELASKYMGAQVANISAPFSSVAKGESLADTARTIDAMGTDILVVRHPMAGAPHMLARRVQASVVNAGDGMHEHPTQSLLDMFTIQERIGRIEGLVIAIIGDVLHSRVARSDIFGLRKMGAHVRVAAPPTMMPVGIERTGAAICASAREAAEGADVVVALRLQLERQKRGLFPSTREYTLLFGVDQELLARAKPGALVLHPGPVNRGVEISSDIVDGRCSAISEQVTNGVAVRMAAMDLLANRGA